MDVALAVVASPFVMPGPRDRPHDRFFKETFSDEAKAAAELVSILPLPVVELFDWVTLRLEPGIIENRKENDRYSDLLFSVRRADVEATVLVFVLFEHQSTEDALMPFRMLRYMLRIWDAWLRKNKISAPPLPPILPVVLAHDERGWRSARHFHELFAGDPGTQAILERFVPSFEIAVDDLSKITDEEIAARALDPATALALWALRDGRSPQAILEHVRFFAAYFASLEPVPGGLEDSDRVIGYLGDAAGERSVDIEVLVATIIAHAPTAQKVVMNSVDRLREEGRQQGREEGRQQGRAEALRHVLIEQLREKFEGVEDADVARVEHANEAALERYLKRIVTADSIDAVFGD
jgi:hypothetical protein